MEIVRPKNFEGHARTLVVDLECRNLRGFLFLWMNILSFLRAANSAEGCLEVLAGIGSPFRIMMVSYWDSEMALKVFAGSRAHRRWMRFLHRHPESLELLNEVYTAPARGSYSSQQHGFAALQPKRAENLRAIV